FPIVANEIRRLAESIALSTHEIGDRITAIQHSSDNLIITSEGGTEKIREGSELFSALEDKFKGIRTSSEITAESAAEIQQIIDEQAASFTQVVTTLQQISAGIDNFSASTQTISFSADNLRQITAELEAIRTQSEDGKK
ncbi:MAG TPA: chemotaxis protein, partial [Treponema sp.]|nr:chemotaxis protein [Treponema sp.]